MRKDKIPLNIDSMLDDVLPKFGYTYSGWSKWAKEAQTLYHSEVIPHEAILAAFQELAPEAKDRAREKVQRDYNQWVLENKDRITSICETKYSSDWIRDKMNYIDKNFK